jgi:guanylate kinase
MELGNWNKNMEHGTRNMEPEQDAGSKRAGILFVISAPSGAGKTSLCKEIIDFFPDLRHSVSFTTRPQRRGEREGVDYHFVTQDVFAAMMTNGAFAEWAEVHGNRYGTAIETLQSSSAAGVDILLDIDCQGAAQLKKNYRHGVFIFILPPGFEELRRRLQSRDTDAEAVIEQRLNNARGEIAESVWYDYLIVNDDFQVALGELKAVITAERCRTERVLPTITEKFDVRGSRFDVRS